MAQFDHGHRIIRSWKHKLEAIHNTMNVNIEILTALITHQDFNSISRADLRIQLVKILKTTTPSSFRIISKHEPPYIIYHKLTKREKQLHCKQCHKRTTSYCSTCSTELTLCEGICNIKYHNVTLTIVQ